MSDRVRALLPRLAELTADEKELVIEFLSEEYDGEVLTQEEWEAAWLPELERRLEELDSGKVVGIPAEEVMRRMKEKYG